MDVGLGINVFREVANPLYSYRLVHNSSGLSIHSNDIQEGINTLQAMIELAGFYSEEYDYDRY